MQRARDMEQEGLRKIENENMIHTHDQSSLRGRAFSDHVLNGNIAAKGRQNKPQPLKLHDPLHYQHQRIEIESADQNEYPLPNSPAPPPYKSPSPDNQVLQQLEHTTLLPPPSQFSYYASALGMEPEITTDLSESDQGRRGRGIFDVSPRLQRRSRSPRRQRAATYSPNTRSGNESHFSVQPNAKPVKSFSEQNMRNGNLQVLNESRSKTAKPVKSSSEQNMMNTEVLDESHSKPFQPNAKPISDQFISNGNQEESQPHSNAPDLLKELDELMGGVEAMVSEVSAQESEFQCSSAAALVPDFEPNVTGHKDSNLDVTEQQDSSNLQGVISERAKVRQVVESDYEKKEDPRKRKDPKIEIVDRVQESYGTNELSSVPDVASPQNDKFDQSPVDDVGTDYTDGAGGSNAFTKSEMMEEHFERGNAVSARNEDNDDTAVNSENLSFHDQRSKDFPPPRLETDDSLTDVSRY